MKLRRAVATLLWLPGETLEGKPLTDRRSASLDGQREATVRELLETCARSLVAGDRHVRANMMTFSTDRSRRQVHAATAYNMQNDPDRDLDIAATAAASGKAVTERRAAIADLVLTQILAVPAWGLQSAEQDRVRPTLRSILSVPIFNPEDADGPLLGSLQVDSDLTVEEAGFNNPESAELLQQFADVLALLLVGVQVRVGGGRTETVKAAPNSRVQNASQMEPGLYVANRSTSVFQVSRNRYS